MFRTCRDETRIILMRSGAHRLRLGPVYMQLSIENRAHADYQNLGHLYRGWVPLLLGQLLVTYPAKNFPYRGVNK